MPRENEKLSQHFWEWEFECPCGCGLLNVNPMFLAKLESLRMMVNLPLVVNSGCRCSDQNRQVGGKFNSAHLRGRAVDIATPHSNLRYRIIRSFEDAGFHRMGIGQNFIHLDDDPDLDQNVVWVYENGGLS
jgi:hypothetical protein